MYECMGIYISLALYRERGRGGRGISYSMASTEGLDIEES